MTCDDAFDVFKAKFNKSYESNEEEKAKVNFCKNYEELKSLIAKNECPDCGLTGIMDKDVRKLRSPGILNSKVKVVAASPEKLATRDCQKYICAVRMGLNKDAQVYSSIDLREAGMVTEAKDQGVCGSCWAFGVTAVLESLILSDQQRGLAKDKSAWQYSASNLSLSEQFIASNLWGFQSYCDGGNFITAVAGTVSNFSTFDLTKNIENNFQAKQSQWLAGTKLDPVITQADYYIPYSTFDQSYGKVAPIQIFDSQTSSIGQDPASRNLVKYFLSNGVAVAATLYAANSITYYQGTTIIDIPCPGRQAINHQVNIVGYGMKTDKNGVKKQVWVIRNSWGKNWGSDGYFYVEQGKNSLCSEMYFYTLLPKYMGNNASYVNPGTRRTGPKYLDSDTPRLVGLNMTKDSSPGSYAASASSVALYVVLTIVGVSIIACVVMRLRKSKSQATQDDVQTFAETFM